MADDKNNDAVDTEKKPKGKKEKKPKVEKVVELPGPRATRSGKPIQSDPTAPKRGTKRKAEEMEEEEPREVWGANPLKERKRKFKAKEDEPKPTERKKVAVKKAAKKPKFDRKPTKELATVCEYLLTD
jgi:hypothetical protein